MRRGGDLAYVSESWERKTPLIDRGKESRQGRQAGKQAGSFISFRFIPRLARARPHTNSLLRIFRMSDGENRDDRRAKDETHDTLRKGNRPRLDSPVSQCGVPSLWREERPTTFSLPLTSPTP